MAIIRNYGHFLSAVIQAIMYTFAAEQIMDSVFTDVAGVARTVLYAALIIIPIILVKFFETKHAQSFMTKD